MDEVIARTGLENPFPPRFVDEVKIYVSKNGDTPIPLRTKKKIVASFFKENSDQVRKFIKATRLKVSEPKAIIKIFEFADNL